MTLLFQILMLIAFSYIVGIILHQFVYYDTLILDYSKWRSGGFGYNQTGTDNVKLLNNQGYMCCLGQISLQLYKNVSKELLLNNGYPSTIEEINMPLLKEGSKNSEFTNKAILINDNESTTPKEKIAKLKSLFGQYGYHLKVINMP